MKNPRKWFCSACRTAGAYQHTDSEAENSEAIQRAHEALNNGCRGDSITAHVPGETLKRKAEEKAVEIGVPSRFPADLSNQFAGAWTSPDQPLI